MLDVPIVTGVHPCAGAEPPSSVLRIVGADRDKATIILLGILGLVGFLPTSPRQDHRSADSHHGVPHKQGDHQEG